MDRILICCQREGVAVKSQYRYSRGGTDITGPTIDLMEVVAQNWGNIEFGFRELARYPGTASKPGESTVEAFAWDLQSNARRKVQFTVRHQMETGSAAKGTRKMKLLTDDRDIYEFVANQAQRRVRTCLENIIPRDIVETACEQCNTTLKANIVVNAKTIGEMLKVFEPFGVTREHIEARIQRRLDAMQPAQMVAMQQIIRSLRDGISHAVDWFPVGETSAPKSAVDAAKDKLKRPTKPAEKQSESAPVNQDPGEVSVTDADERAAFLAKIKDGFAKSTKATDRNTLLDMALGEHAPYGLTDDELDLVNGWNDAAKEKERGTTKLAKGEQKTMV